jgi:hypothetical protein
MIRAMWLMIRGMMMMTSPVTNVQSPEVIVKKRPDRGLTQGVVIGDNN